MTALLPRDVERLAGRDCRHWADLSEAERAAIKAALRRQDTKREKDHE